MIDGMLLFAGTTVYSPWFPREADMLRVTAECIATNSGSVTIKLYTKNDEQTGNGQPVDESVSISRSAEGRSTQEWTSLPGKEGVREMLRFRFEVPSGENATDWILFRLLPAV